MADKHAGKLAGVGTDNLNHVIKIYQGKTVERSPHGMVRHEGLTHFEKQSGVT